MDEAASAAYSELVHALAFLRREGELAARQAEVPSPRGLWSQDLERGAALALVPDGVDESGAARYFALFVRVADRLDNLELSYTTALADVMLQSLVEERRLRLHQVRSVEVLLAAPRGWLRGPIRLRDQWGRHWYVRTLKCEDPSRAPAALLRGLAKWLEARLRALAQRLGWELLADSSSLASLLTAITIRLVDVASASLRQALCLLSSAARAASGALARLEARLRLREALGELAKYVPELLPGDAALMWLERAGRAIRSAALSLGRLLGERLAAQLGPPY